MPGVVLAHGGEHAPRLSDAWSLSPWLLVPAVIALAGYVLGVTRLWRRAGIGRGIARREATAFAGGVAALFAALVWPLDALGEWSLAAHMAQHMVLLALAPPLVMLGRPGAALAHAVPTNVAVAARRIIAPVHTRAAKALAAATGAQVAVMGLWHLPAATAAALAHEAVHWAMHASFLLAGLWFWAAMVHRIRDRDTGVGGALVAVVVVMMQMGFVGALLTFAPQPLYATYLPRAPALGLDPMTDQQLAGLLMWVPASVPYLVGGLWLLAAWFARAAKGASRRSAAPATPR
ncbi:cytochrome c oxidase assembly protein [Cognatilysobacter bugurensis]|uniref:Cytochrome c oxidase assembly protein n=1 Tax=Cognatilysobacter bugurensis TaxID=543356 RepID=A0A918SYU3_9GAMM|nr:cytochrome c oxidase assembly protein [Lysobacter bugurensis]GHA79259.1 hypothetical protein GCM10007067_15920 [Lysobacter bugurensis]